VNPSACPQTRRQGSHGASPGQTTRCQRPGEAVPRPSGRICPPPPRIVPPPPASAHPGSADLSLRSPAFPSPYLGLDADLHDGPQHGEDVADHQEDVPAVEEFHAIRQTHALAVTALEEPAELLRREKKKKHGVLYHHPESFCRSRGTHSFG